jgi:hypothetical protein
MKIAQEFDYQMFTCCSLLLKEVKEYGRLVHQNHILKCHPIGEEALRLIEAYTIFYIAGNFVKRSARFS